MPNVISNRQVNKTASYTVNPEVDRYDTLFTNGGASGAVTFTLPQPTRAHLGRGYGFASLVDQNLTVAARTAGDIITKDDTAADSVALSTNGEKIGGRLRADCVETALNSGVFKWLVTCVSAGHTVTVT